MIINFIVRQWHNQDRNRTERFTLEMPVVPRVGESVVDIDGEEAEVHHVLYDFTENNSEILVVLK